MTEYPFNRLLDAMPKIAKAVNDFNSEEVQRRAFNALLGAMGVDNGAALPAQEVNNTPSSGESSMNETVPDSAAEAASAAPTTNGSQPQRRRSRTPVKQWTPNRNLNIRPGGKQSLTDFVAEKQPTNGFERNLVSVYWLREVLGKDPVDIADVMACYRACNWPIPQDLPNALSVTGARRGWLDTHDRSNLTVTVSGENAVLHDLPAPKKSKKAK